MKLLSNAVRSSGVARAYAAGAIGAGQRNVSAMFSRFLRHTVSKRRYVTKPEHLLRKSSRDVLPSPYPEFFQKAHKFQGIWRGC